MSSGLQWDFIESAIPLQSSELRQDWRSSGGGAPIGKDCLQFADIPGFWINLLIILQSVAVLQSCHNPITGLHLRRDCCEDRIGLCMARDFGAIQFDCAAIWDGLRDQRPDFR